MKGKNFSCNNVSGKRKKSDYYATPFTITKQLLEREKLFGSILEPAAGEDGAIVKVLKEFNYSCIYYDKETDFLKETRQFDTIITNPPFSIAMEFILKAKQVATKKIFFLLPLSYLHGKKRFDLIYSDTLFPLKKIYIFTRYPMLGDKLREDGKYRTGMMVYAWYLWEKEYVGKCEINWLDNNNFVINSKEKQEPNDILF
jgi:uncharacterized protein YozE (UPF0346 family)